MLVRSYLIRCCGESLARALLLCCLLPFHAGALADEKPYAPDSIPGTVIITAEEVVELILSRPGLIIIDSRKSTEYSKGHIEGAVNILNTDMQREDLETLSPDRATTIIFYCNGTRCLRSTDAIKKATEWGYTNLFWFRGGWKEWTDKRLPVITD